MPIATALQADDLPKPRGGEMACRNDDLFPLQALYQGPPGLPGHLRVHIRPRHPVGLVHLRRIVCGIPQNEGPFPL